MLYTENEKASFPGACDRVAAGKLYKQLRQKYGAALDIDFYDPRCFIFLFDTWRYRLRGGEVTWVLDGKVIFRGIPEWHELEQLVDAHIAARSHGK